MALRSRHILGSRRSKSFAVLLIVAFIALVSAEDISVELTSGECFKTIISPKVFQPNTIIRYLLKTQPGKLIDIYCHDVTMLTKNTLRQGISCADFVLFIIEGDLRYELCGRQRSTLYKSRNNQVIIEARTGLKGIANYTCHLESIDN